MRIYELEYFKGSNIDRIYIPGLLTEDMPDNLPDFSGNEYLTMSFDVKGKHKTEYLSELRDTLKKIFDDYKGVKPDLKYKILLPDDVKEELRRQMKQEPPLMEFAEKIIALATKKIPYLVPSIIYWLSSRPAQTEQVISTPEIHYNSDN